MSEQERYTPQDKAPIPEKTTRDFKFDPVSGISEIEEQILKKISPETLVTCRRLLDTNMTRERKKITAIRSEDIFYLLQTLEQGYLSTKQHILTQKGFLDEEVVNTHLYVEINPESEQVVKNNIPHRYTAAVKYKFVASRNHAMYGHIAIKQGIYRNIWPYLKNEQDTERAIKEKFYLGGPLFWENFFDECVNEIKTGGLYLAGFIYNQIDKKKIEREYFNQFWKSLKKRAGILIGFNDTLLSNYTVTNDASVTDADDTVVIVPNQRLPITTMFGIEPQGEFEDTVLEKIGITEE